MKLKDSFLLCLDGFSGWKEEAAGLQGDTIKITTLRKIYQRAVAVPLDSLDDMWRVSHT